MTRILAVLANFFVSKEPEGPVLDHLLHGSLNSAASNELYYAELIHNKWDDKIRNYTLPLGWPN
jgi:hypothetical protein